MRRTGEAGCVDAYSMSRAALLIIQCKQNVFYPNSQENYLQMDSWCVGMNMLSLSN